MEYQEEHSQMALVRLKRAAHVVTRDDDLLSIGTYEGVTIISPETLLTMLRRPG
jgi:predicted nucleic acid-binding protein